MIAIPPDLEETCKCGEELPTHLKDLMNNTKSSHICSCERKYWVRGNIWIFVGYEENPFMKVK
jgi:hypothetical protein